MQQQSLEKMNKFVLDYIQWNGSDSVMHISSDDFIVKVQIIKKHDHEENFDEWVQKCQYCHQKVSLRKVSFTRVFLSAIIKAYQYAKKNATHIIHIGDIWLTPIEYSRFNDLVRFGLAYKEKWMWRWIYWLPLQRICQFVNGEWKVAEYFLTDPTKEKTDPQKRIMSESRIWISEIPKSQEIMDATNQTMSKYFNNPDALLGNQKI